MSSLPTVQKPKPRTIDQKNANGEMVKAGELIEIRFPQNHLTLQDGRIFDRLLEHAWPEIQALVRAGKSVTDQWFSCPIWMVRGPTHKGGERVRDSIDRLMQTIVLLPSFENGRPRVDSAGNIADEKTQLLSTTKVTRDENAQNAEIRYKFTKELIAALENSTHWGRIKSMISYALSSKYAYRLYQAAAMRVNLQMSSKDFSVEAFRDVLAVEKGTYPNFPQLNQRVIVPAVEEVNALSDVIVEVEPIRVGGLQRGKLTGFRMSWRKKTPEEWDRATRELLNSKVGRKQRIKGTVENLTVAETFEFIR